MDGWVKHVEKKNGGRNREEVEREIERYKLDDKEEHTRGLKREREKP